MSRPLDGVKCTVQNCKFWDKGHRCLASAIEVNVDGGGQLASRSPETIVIRSNQVKLEGRLV